MARAGSVAIQRARRRGKYARRYAQGGNVVVVEPHESRVFPDKASVNSSLRALASIIRCQRFARAKG